MPGGLTQLQCIGVQDHYLTTMPSVTFWKLVYRKYTNFAIESIQQTINGSVGFNKRVTCQISRNGDLINNVFLEIVLRKSATATAGTADASTFFPAEALVSDIELEIGGQRIDKHYADWFRINDSLFRKDGDRAQYRKLTDFVDNEAPGTIKRFFLPLIFFFNKVPGLSLPMISLQYHDVKLNINLGNAPTGIDATFTPIVNVWVDYVYLDTDERRRYAQLQHEYLIEQLQYTGEDTIAVDAYNQKTTNYRLNLNHPTKYLAFVCRDPNKHGRYVGSYTSDTANTQTYAEGLAPVYSAKLTLNGQERFSERVGAYFNSVTPWIHANRARPHSGVYLYSFAIRADEHQPSGTLNFSRVDTAVLTVTTKIAANAYGRSLQPDFLAANVVSEQYTVSACADLTGFRVYAMNYNIFRIMSGMGGLAYAA